MAAVIYRHKTAPCKKVLRLDLTEREAWESLEFGRGIAYARVCECGARMWGEAIRGKDTGKVKSCNAKCESAAGPMCDCPCRGSNHGGKHAA